jgi:hypothetical protein
MNTEDKMCIKNDEDMDKPYAGCNGVCVKNCCRTVAEPIPVNGTEPVITDSDLMVADLKQQLDFANEKVNNLQETNSHLCEQIGVWRGMCRRYADISFDRLKIIRELDRKLHESRWTKFVRWFKKEWDYDIYA